MSASSDEPVRKFRADYAPPDFSIHTVELDFDLRDGETRVVAELEVQRRNPGAADLRLNGEQLTLQEVRIDGELLPADRYDVTEDALVIASVPDRFVLQTTVSVVPESNTSLSGLYRSSGNYCTQCEAEGFRRITYFLDRPDVMSRYRVRLAADRKRYPVLLSNGNRVEAGELEDGRHYAVYEDPHLKPCYLFALVAGDLRCHRGAFTTASGREVRLEIWVEPRELHKCEHALASLQRAMAWDEERYGLEYDLDAYMIVAVGDFNMGAMENKGLNIFNSKYVLADPATATDDDYEDVESVIAHEYFHNWTGNRVTCRDWFQLTLKEGLTVFRDQEFTADMTSAAVKRISDVRVLRTAQFAEDQGPMSHPVRPDSYIEMNNFYTVTVYNKGAEVVRMYQTLLGREGFRKGMDLYFERHDGSAVTCDDFRAAMADANGVELDQFEQWYRQSSTPTVEAEGHYDQDSQRYRLRLRQTPGVTADGPGDALHIPLRFGLLGAQGHDLPLGFEADAPTEQVLELREREQEFVFEGIRERPVPSLGRGFSAPVRVVMEEPLADLAFRMAHDGDAFNRWDAGQRIATQLLLAAIEAGKDDFDPVYVSAFGRLLEDESIDGSLRALAMSLPQPRDLAQLRTPVDVDGIHRARLALIRELATAHAGSLAAIYERHAARPYVNDREGIAARREKNAALACLCATGSEWRQRARAQFEAADNMTDAQAALEILVEYPGEESGAVVEGFYQRFRDEPLVIDKWFSAQAAAEADAAFERVLALVEHPAFTNPNPNRFRSLLGVFAMRNQRHFHREDGRGYQLVADHILAMDPRNPQVAARVAGAFTPWRRFDARRQALAQEQLDRMLGEKLSKDVFEVLSRARNSE